PPDHDDDHGRAPGRPPAGARHRHGLGAAPAARHHDSGRPPALAGADAVHDPGRLSLLRPAGEAVRRRPLAPTRPGRGRRGLGAPDEPHAPASHTVPPGGRSPPPSYMNISEPFIKRPVGTSLLALGVLLAGIVAYRQLPVAPLPQVEFPVISVSAA